MRACYLLSCIIAAHVCVTLLLFWINQENNDKVIHRLSGKSPSSFLNNSSNVIQDWQKKYFIIDDMFKVIYCYIPKVGCSTTKRVMLVLSGLAAVRNPLAIDGITIHDVNFTTFANMSKEDMQYRLDNYHKFMVVRDPIQRIWSAYLDKIFLTQFWRLGRIIVTKYRSKRTIKERFCGQDASFKEFLKMTADRPLDDVNDHWIPYKDMCLPKVIKYDSVLRLENYANDLEHLLHNINATDVVDLSGIKTHTSSKLSIVHKAIERTIGKDMKMVRSKTYTEKGVQRMCMTTGELANRLWTSFIWRGYVPLGAPYPAVLNEKYKISAEQLKRIYSKVLDGVKIKSNNITVAPAINVIKEAFAGLDKHYLAKWRAGFQDDFEMFDYKIPPFLNAKSE